MELSRLAAILWRRRWIIVVVALMGAGALGVHVATRRPTYEAGARVQLTAPADEEIIANRAPMVVRLQDTLEDLLTVTRNNFIEVLKSREATRRTLNRLRERGQACGYSLDVTAVRDSNFLDVLVRAPCRDVVASITNTRVDEAIAYYRELRAIGVTATIVALRKEQEAAAEALQAAEEAFASFRRDRGVGSIGDAVRASQDVLARLELERYRQAPDGAVARGATADNDRLVDKWKTTLRALIALEPAYRALEAQVTEARRKLEYVSSRYAEAELRGQIIQGSSFVQRVEEAQTPGAPASRLGAVAVLTLTGSLGLGVLVALLVDYLAEGQRA